MSEKQPKIICAACGTSYVNHRFLFVSNFIEETIGKIGDKIFDFSSQDGFGKVALLVEKILYYISYYLGIVRYNKDDIEKAVTGRSKLIWEEARIRSIPMEQVVVMGRPIDYYRAKIKGKMFYFQSLPVPPWLPQKGYKWLDDKLVLFNKLIASGIPAPATKKISTLSEAISEFEKLKKPVIIKPKFGSRGRHTTTNIKTKEELIKAFNLAKEITPWMVIQEHLSGSVCRATVIDNKLVGFFKAELPKVTGDGKKTIYELILEKNNNRHKRLSPILINEDLINFLNREGHTLESVPKEDTVINLSAKTGRMYGSYTKEILPEVHPKMYEIFKKAGELVSAPVVGFDLIIEDPTLDPDTQRWGIIECNSLPFIDLHYFALEGEPINLAKNVWDLWDVKTYKN